MHTLKCIVLLVMCVCGVNDKTFVCRQGLSIIQETISRYRQSGRGEQKEARDNRKQKF